MKTPEQVLVELSNLDDPSERNLRVAELVTQLFQEIGCEPVVVGGSAVEAYSDGRYVSGDVDLCYSGSKLPTPREREEIMSRVGRSLSIRKWDVAGVMVDVLGWIETSARTPFQRIGGVTLIQIEDLIPERLLVATVPARQEERLEVVRMLVGLVVQGLIEADVAELLRVADCPDYGVGEELRSIIAEFSAGSIELP